MGTFGSDLNAKHNCVYNTLLVTRDHSDDSFSSSTYLSYVDKKAFAGIMSNWMLKVERVMLISRGQREREKPLKSMSSSSLRCRMKSTADIQLESRRREKSR